MSNCNKRSAANTQAANKRDVTIGIIVDFVRAFEFTYNAFGCSLHRTCAESKKAGPVRLNWRKQWKNFICELPRFRWNWLSRDHLVSHFNQILSVIQGKFILQHSIAGPASQPVSRAFFVISITKFFHNWFDMQFFNKNAEIFLSWTDAETAIPDLVIKRLCSISIYWLSCWPARQSIRNAARSASIAQTGRMLCFFRRNHAEAHLDRAVRRPGNCSLLFSLPYFGVGGP